ncbi:phosphoglycolate phosphatase, partial [Salmonella enterica subsp. enterica serovar Infantis]
MESELTWSREERSTMSKKMGKTPFDEDIPSEYHVRILRKLFERDYGAVAEDGTFFFPHVADTLGALHAGGVSFGLVTPEPTP